LPRAIFFYIPSLTSSLCNQSILCMKNRLYRISCAVFLFFSACGMGGQNSTVPESSPKDVELDLRRIKKVEYFNADELRAEAKRMQEKQGDEMAQLYGRYYARKADFLASPTEEHAKNWLGLYEELKQRKLYKLMVEIDMFLTLNYYYDNQYDSASERVHQSFDYCFEPDMVLERNALIYALSPVATMGSPELRKEEITQFLSQLNGTEWTFYHSRIYIGLAKTYFHLEEYDGAKKVIEQAIRNNSKAGFVYELSECYDVLAAIARETEQPPAAIIGYYYKAIDANRRYGNTFQEINYRRIGHIHFNNKQYADAQSAYQKAVIYGYLNRDSTSLSVDYSYLGWAYFHLDKKHNFEKANHYYERAIDYSGKQNLPYRIALERKIWSLRGAGRKQEAKELEMVLLREKNKSLLNNKNNKLEDFKINSMLALKSRNEQVFLLQAQNDLQRIKLKRQRIVYFFLFALATFLIALLYLFFKNKQNLKKIKQKEQELETTLRQLDAQYKLAQQQNEKLEALVLQIEESNKNLENFAHLAAHDINAPLRTITTFSDMLSKKYGSTLPPKDKELQDFVVSSGKVLTNIVNGLLEFSKIASRSRLQLHEVELNELISGCVSLIADRVRETSATVRIQPGFPRVMGVKELLQQLFINLLTNAIKFSKPDQAPLLHISHEAEENGYCTIRVKDNGIGIPRMFQSEIFQLFKKLHPAKVNDGSGMGLAICKKIVEKHGGKIWVESDGMEGAVFVFTLPLANVPS
jgi:signal transduction histidine kinase